MINQRVQRVKKASSSDRFLQIAGRPQRQGHLALRHDGTHQHRDGAGGWMLVQVPQHAPTVHARHHHVQHDGVWLVLLGHLQGALGLAAGE